MQNLMTSKFTQYAKKKFFHLSYNIIVMKFMYMSAVTAIYIIIIRIYNSRQRGHALAYTHSFVISFSTVPVGHWQPGTH